MDDRSVDDGMGACGSITFMSCLEYIATGMHKARSLASCRLLECACL